MNLSAREKTRLHAIMPKRAGSPDELGAAKQEIPGKALDIMTEHGYEGLTMRRLGHRLGVTSASIYKHFNRKEDRRQ